MTGEQAQSDIGSELGLEAAELALLELQVAQHEEVADPKRLQHLRKRRKALMGRLTLEALEDTERLINLAEGSELANSDDGRLPLTG